jgi:hypothetical protein
MYVDALLALHGSISGNTVTGANAFASSANINSANVIDLSSGYAPNGIGAAQTRDMGAGNDLAKLRVQVTTAFSGGTSAEFQICQSDDSGQSTNVTVVGTSGAIAVASLPINARVEVEINTKLLSKGQRYLWMRTVNVGANTTGAIYADIGPDIQDFKTYPVGFPVL